MEVEDNTGAEIKLGTGKKSSADIHIEYKVVCDESFFEHLHLKRLVTDDKIPYPMSTSERIKIAKAIHELPEDLISASKSLYNGMD